MAIARPSFDARGEGVARSRQQGPHRVEQGLVAVHQLDLDLAPGLHLERLLGTAREDRGGDGVIGQLGQRTAVGVAEHGHEAPRVQRRDRADGCTAQQSGHRREEVGGRFPDRAAQGRVQLPPRAGPGRQLDVPAGVGAPGPATHRDARGEEPQVRGVEVAGLKQVLDRVVDRGHPVHARQLVGGGRHERAVDIELALHLEMPAGHV